MTLKSIHLINIQSHKDSLFEFPPTGIIRIAGGNSSGKSAVFRPLLYLLNNGIAKPKIRRGLVSNGCSYGEAVYTRTDGVELTIHITIEAATTWVSLSKPNGDSIKRALADKNYREMAAVFGWHYNAERDISINMASGDGPILFFTTPHRANGEVLEMALTDRQAEYALENLDTTLKQAQKIRDDAISAIPMLEDTLVGLEVYNVDELNEKQNELISLFNVLNTLYIPEIPEIEAVPDIKLLSVYKPSIPEVVFPKVVDVNCAIPDILPIAKEVQEVQNGKCPTCGRRLLDAG